MSPEAVQRRIDRGTHVPAAPIAEAAANAVQSGEITWSGIAKLCGIVHSKQKTGDSTTLRRSLGLLKPGINGHNGKQYGHSGLVRYEIAVAVIRALDLWPTDYGI